MRESRDQNSAGLETQAGLAKRHRSMATIGAVGLFLLFTHQNCAPAAMSAGSTASSKTASTQLVSEDGQVSIIDDVRSSTNLSFNYKEVEVSEQSSEVVLQGKCSVEQDGSVLAWKIHRVNGDGSAAEAIANGRVNCLSGSFKVRLAPAQSLACGEKYKVSAQLGLGNPGEADLSRHCASL